MAKRMRLNGRTAVITGAGGGIGRAIALSLARRGCHLAVVDVDQSGLLETAELASESKVRLSQHVVDVTDRAAIAKLPAEVKAAHDGVDVLVNNAGVALGGTFEQVSEEDFEWLFDVNFWGVVRMTRAFLPLLQASNDARVVNLSSIFGLIAPPMQVPYASSKFAVRGFSEALRHELEGTSIGVTVVHPGGVKTSIAQNARIPKGVSDEEVERELARHRKLLRMPPEIAGETIVRGMERRKSRVLVGSDAKILSLIVRMFPVSYWSLFGKLRGD